MAGLCAHAALAPTALILGAIGLSLQRDGHTPSGAMLAALCIVAVAAIIGGADGAVAAALVWRVGAELVGQGAGPALHVVAPVVGTAGLHLADAPTLATVGLGSIALVLAIDWFVRRLADWRLGIATSVQAAGAACAVGAPLVVFPDATSALAAVVAMGLVRQIRWTGPPAYAAGR